MRKFGIVFGLLVVTLAAVIGFSLMPRQQKAQKKQTSEKARQADELVLAQQLYEDGKVDESLEIVHQYKGEMELLSENGLRWLELFINASEEKRDIPQLTVLFEFFPEVFKEHENASLLVADAYINDNRVKDYTKIRSLWEDRETQVAKWYVLDVDKLLLNGRRQEAIALLKSRTFKDKADVGRLVRLALIYTDENPSESWKLLGEAYSKDPQNADVRTYRARLLESAGKYSRAHAEYQAAARLDPSNLFLKDQLAEFYLRQKQYPMAMKLWKENLSPPSIDTIWLKALFWGKVTTPLDFEWEEIPAPRGRLEPLIQYMAGLDQDEFWDEEEFSHVPNNKYYLRTRQELFWLRLLSALKHKKEKEAYKLLQYNPFLTNSWNPELETALKRVINYRQKGSLKADPALIPVAELVKDRPGRADLPPLFKKLDYYADHPDEEMPESLAALLQSSEAYSAVFLAIKWYETGLQLHQLPVIPNDFPDWVAYNITEALNQNRSTLEALEFASLQKPDPKLTLLTAELLIAGGDSEAALEKLNQIAKLDNDTGYRAAWLAGLLYIEKKDWEHAKNSVISQPRLVNDLLGKETLARIAHLEGDSQLAEKLYTSIEKISPEARSYLAKKAYAEKKWKRARELTEQLIADYPDNPTLKKNLQRIIQEQQKAVQ